MKHIIGVILLIFTVGSINAQKMDSLKQYVFSEYADHIGETYKFNDEDKLFFKTKLVLTQVNYYIYDANGKVLYDSLINSEYDNTKDYFAYSLVFYHKRTKEIYVINPLVELHRYYIRNGNNISEVEVEITKNNNFKFIKK